MRHFLRLTAALASGRAAPPPSALRGLHAGPMQRHLGPKYFGLPRHRPHGTMATVGPAR